MYMKSKSQAVSGIFGNFPEQAGVYHPDWNDPVLEFSSNTNARIMPATHIMWIFYNKEFDHA